MENEPQLGELLREQVRFTQAQQAQESEASYQAYQQALNEALPDFLSRHKQSWIDELTVLAEQAAQDGHFSAEIKKLATNILDSHLVEATVGEVARHFDEQGVTTRLSLRDNSGVRYFWGEEAESVPASQWWAKLQINWEDK